MAGKIFIITGPSGVGKTTVAYELLKERPTLKKVITCTTRAMRPGETNGVDYHFITKEEMELLRHDGKLFEYARVYDREYGSRTADVEALQEQGFDVLFVIDVQGARTIKADHIETITIFIAAESTDAWLKRLESRPDNGGNTLEERKHMFENEMAFAVQCDHIVVNKEGALTKTIEEVAAIMDRS
jgi:guanylate kinase